MNSVEELKQVKIEIEADLAAVNRLLSRSEREKKVAALVRASQPEKTTSQLAEEIIKSIAKDFTVQDICFHLRKLGGKNWNPYQSPIVSNIINKLRQRNPPQITVIVPGKGSRSGVYRYNAK